MNRKSAASESTETKTVKSPGRKKKSPAAQAPRQLTSDMFGADLSPAGGTAFRVWAPSATKVFVVGSFNAWKHTASSLLKKNDDGTWSGTMPNAKAGDTYMFYVEGPQPEFAREMRDPFARELTLDPAWPECRCVIVDPQAYHWRATGFTTPKRSDIVVYQLHVGCFWGPDRPHRTAKFLDIIDRIEHLSSLGITAVQFLPIAEFETSTSMGYNGVDLFSAEMDYEVDEDTYLWTYINRANTLFNKKGFAPVTIDEARGSYNQTKLLFDLFHAWGIAVIPDVVYNHAGNPIDDRSMLNLDKPDPDKNRSLYFSDKDHCGPVFDYSKEMVREFLIRNALFHFEELHVDGLRFDQVSVIDHEGAPDGWKFCQTLTDVLFERFPDAILNAEYWPVNNWVVKTPTNGGAGFNSTQHDAIRRTVRAAVRNASHGMATFVSMNDIAAALHHPDFNADQIFTALSNHDIVYAGDGMDREDRLPKLADNSDAWSWYARSRTRAASGILLTAPGIPMLFMGQEMLETKRWHDSRQEQFLVWWDGLDNGVTTVTDFFKFMRDLITLRSSNRVMREGWVDTYHVHDGNRILAFRRGMTGEKDMVIVASFNDNTFFNYEIGFPQYGGWQEVFNSDAYDNWVNPNCHGNGGYVFAGGRPMHDMSASAAITIPANSILVFRKE